MTAAGRRSPREAAAGLGQSVCRVLSAAPAAASALPQHARRGQVDACALRARFSDAALHARLAPADPLQRRWHEACEQARVDALGAARWPGVALNLSAQNTDQLLGADLPQRLLAVLHSVRVAIASPLPGDAAQLPVLSTALARHCDPVLAQLRHLRQDQQACALLCRQLWDLAGLGESVNPVPAAQKPSPSPQPSQPIAPMASELRLLRQQRKTAVDVLHRIAVEPRGTLVPPQQSVVDVDQPYAVFTRRHDVVQHAEAICTPAQRVPLLQRLSVLTARQRRSESAAVVQLQRCLMARQQRRWQFDAACGVLDPARLTSLVTDPLRPPQLRYRVDAPALDTQVTLLVDNSGSLRGKPIEIAAASVHWLVGLLERCGVSTEVLGYTTVGWRGGEAAAGWRKAGSPTAPGRLAALRHVIYKAAGESAARSRNRLAAMLHDDLLRENVDGEALQWALQRIARSAARRRVVMVLCDGEPQDQATLAANGPLYLRRHLQRVLNAAAAGPVQVVAIGLHRDVSACFPQAVVVDEVAQLARVLPQQLARVLGATRRPVGGRRSSGSW